MGITEALASKPINPIKLS